MSDIKVLVFYFEPIEILGEFFCKLFRKCFCKPIRNLLCRDENTGKELAKVFIKELEKNGIMPDEVSLVAGISNIKNKGCIEDSISKKKYDYVFAFGEFCSLKHCFQLERLSGKEHKNVVCSQDNLCGGRIKRDSLSLASPCCKTRDELHRILKIEPNYYKWEFVHVKKNLCCGALENIAKILCKQIVIKARSGHIECANS